MTRRAIVADADDAARELCRDALLNRFDIEEALDGREAMARALSDPPSVLVTEIGLPILDGPALCEILRNDVATRQLPIVVVTDEQRPDQIARAWQAGADAVIVKPAQRDVITQEIERLLSVSSELRERSRVAGEQAAHPLARSAQLLEQSKHQRHARSKDMRRFSTTVPPHLPPELRCLLCDQRLVYDHSNVGGVNEQHAEQWDYFTCGHGCGRFQFRHRTRKLRRSADVDGPRLTCGAT